MSAHFVLSKILGIQANYLLRMGWNMPKVTTTSAGEEKRLLLRAALPHHSLSSSSNKRDCPDFSSQLCPLLLLTQGKGKKKGGGEFIFITLNFAYCIKKPWSSSKHKAGSRSVPPCCVLNGHWYAMQPAKQLKHSSVKYSLSKSWTYCSSKKNLWNNAALDKNWDWKLQRGEKKTRNTFE